MCMSAEPAEATANTCRHGDTSNCSSNSCILLSFLLLSHHLSLIITVVIGLIFVDAGWLVAHHNDCWLTWWWWPDVLHRIIIRVHVFIRIII